MELEALALALARRGIRPNHGQHLFRERCGIAKSGIIDFFRFGQSFLHVITTGKLLQRHEADVIATVCRLHATSRKNEVTAAAASRSGYSHRIESNLAEAGETKRTKAMSLTVPCGY